MGTRASINFYNEGSAEPSAIIFRHWDGYPDCTGKDIQDFFAAIEAQAPEDSRFNDPTMLASRYVVWLARQYATGFKDPGNNDYTQVNHADTKPLNFLSVRVMQQEAGGIEYRYRIICSKRLAYLGDKLERPKVMVDGIYAKTSLSLEEAIDVGFYADEDEEEVEAEAPSS